MYCTIEELELNFLDFRHNNFTSLVVTGTMTYTDMLSHLSDAGRWKNLGVSVVIDGHNLPFPVGIGLTNLPP